MMTHMGSVIATLANVVGIVMTSLAIGFNGRRLVSLAGRN